MKKCLTRNFSRAGIQLCWRKHGCSLLNGREMVVVLCWWNLLEIYHLVSERKLFKSSCIPGGDCRWMWWSLGYSGHHALLGKLQELHPGGAAWATAAGWEGCSMYLRSQAPGRPPALQKPVKWTHWIREAKPLPPVITLQYLHLPLLIRLFVKWQKNLKSPDPLL